MNILIVAATKFEIQGFTDWLAIKGTPKPTNHKIENVAEYRIGTLQVAILISGVGIPATTYTLTKLLQYQRYDFVLQAGVGGSFDTNIALGDVIFLDTDQFGDLGAEDKDNYYDIFELNLLDKNLFPYINGKLATPKHPVHDKILLQHSEGLTINTVSGSEKTISRRKEKYKSGIESMEGAALHYVCLQENIPFAQIRSISNYVIPRDKTQWKMREAIINLNKWLVDFIEAVERL